MEEISVWSGRETRALREAMRLSLRDFADYLGVTARMVSTWEARREDLKPRPVNQAALDTCFRRLDREAQARFRSILKKGFDSKPKEEIALPKTLALSIPAPLSVSPLLGWLANRSKTPVVELYEQVERTTLQLRQQPHALQWANRLQRENIQRGNIVEFIEAYYQEELEHKYRLFEAIVDGHLVRTSIVLGPSRYLELHMDLGKTNEQASFRRDHAFELTAFDEFQIAKAVERLAIIEITGAIVTNRILYRLQKIDARANGKTHMAYAGVDFLEYALCGGLLESEILEAISANQISTNRAMLPLRGRLLPTLDAVLDFGNRVCVGGVQALFAIARPDTQDYLILIQLRSARVIDSNGRLALIPKAFHQPIVEAFSECSLLQTIKRELEEELFGREDLDSSQDFRFGGPLHPEKLTPPMRWINDRIGTDKVIVECVGVGFDSVSGNYEFVNLIVINDPAWWSRFGGMVEANWESSGLYRYSTKDLEGLVELSLDPRWSNEGLFAYLLALQRLANVGEKARLALPKIEMET